MIWGNLGVGWRGGRGQIFPSPCTLTTRKQERCLQGKEKKIPLENPLEAMEREGKEESCVS